MKKYLSSMCGGNYRGYQGTKEEIEEMFAKCFEEMKDYVVQESSISNLKYDYENRDRMKANDEGIYTVTYWSKW